MTADSKVFQTRAATIPVLVLASLLLGCPAKIVNIDSGTSDSGTSDSGTSDSGTSDSGTSDSGTSDSGPPVVIDFQQTSAQFPPTVNKIGFNSFWNSTSNDSNFDAWTIRRSAKYRAPMISGLIEPKSLLNLPDAGPDAYEEWDGDKTAAQLEAQSCALWQPGSANALFYDNAGVIQARKPSDPDLVALRDLAQAQGLITFLQISGTPGIPTPNPRTSRFNGLFNLAGEPTTGGNWYPLPVASEIPVLAHAFGTLPDALGYSAPTLYAFWQEPSHTLDESIGATASIARYAGFYSQLSNELVTQCRWQRCPVAGAQLNSNDGDFSPPDGFRYKTFVDELVARRAANPALEMPLDYFTIQNYAAQWNDNIVRNSRIALGTGFDWTPVLMNEWDYCVNSRPQDGCTSALSSFSERYDGPEALAALRWLVDSIDRPDISHVLLREKVLRDRDKTTGADSYPWTQVPVLFLASMTEFRRPARSGFAQIPMVAAGDDDQLRILLWNDGNVSRTLPLTLRNIPATLVGQVLSVKRISKAIRDAVCPAPSDVMDANHEVTCWQDAASPTVIAGATLSTSFTIAPREAVMIFAGAPPAYTSTLFSDHFVRSSQLVKRDGTAAAPLGMAHFDPRTGSLTAAVQSGGTAVGKVTLKNITDTLKLSTRLASMGAPSATTIAGVRVDYLDANKLAIKSVFYRDSRWTTGATPWTMLQWPPTAAHSELSTNLCGTVCTNGGGTNVTLDLLSAAPTGWAAVRDVVVGVVLTGATADTTYRVDFP